ncbi:MAG TPA: hypothetical protein VN886_07215 [Acidimicrobiales bacterium]|nr:hypothetical protein [Acidimicrobiales bacterium]
MLAIVQDEQQRLVAQELEYRREGGYTGRGLDAQRACHGLVDVIWATDTGQLDEPGAVRVAGDGLRRRLQGQSGLANATDAAQRHEARSGERLDHLGELLLPPDERGRLGWEIPGKAVERT